MANSRQRAFARNVDFSFIVSGSERTFTFRVSLNTLPTLATLVRDIIAKGIEMLWRSKLLFDRDTLKTIYNAFVLPHFDYCALVWNNCSKTLQNKFQNKAGRIITGYCYKTASDTVRSKLSWDTLEATREKQLETCMIQIMKDNSIDYLRELFTIHANQTYGLRSNNRVLHLPRPKTNALKRSFSYKGAAAWNNIEENRKF